MTIRAILLGALGALGFLSLLIAAISQGSWADFGWSMLMLALATVGGGLAWVTGRKQLRAWEERPPGLLRWFHSLR